MSFSKLRSIFLTGLLIASSASLSAQENVDANSGTIALEGSNWQLVQLTVLGGFVFSPDDHSKYVLNFRSGNRLTGTSDCNSINGSWQLNNSELRFEPFATTRALCPPGSLHNNLVLYLKDVNALRMREGHLILTTPTQGVEIEFESRD